MGRNQFFRNGKRSLLASPTHYTCSMETSRNSVKAKSGFKVMTIGGKSDQLGRPFEALHPFVHLMTLTPNLSLTELLMVSMEHLQWTWHASKECFPFWSPGSVPRFGDLLVLQLLRLYSLNLPCLYSTFHLEYPLVHFRLIFRDVS